MHAILTKGLLLAALAAPLAGCVIDARDDTPSPSPTQGTMTVAYTIEGTTDPDLCDAYNVGDAELVVYTLAGSVITKQYQPCVDFQVGAVLFPGTYDADLTMVDRANGARSITKPLNAIDIIADTDVVIDVDFPPDSFL